MSEPVFLWTSQFRVLGRVRLAATRAGLCKVALGRESDDAFHAWLYRLLQPSSVLRQQTLPIEQALAEIDAYLSGRRRVFETTLDLHGTPFQLKVWQAVTCIPYGATTTYSEIGVQIGRASLARAVGAANGANPLPLFVPCHRVIGAAGALRGYGGGLELKAALLELERSAPWL